MNKRKAPEGAITNNQIDNTTKNMVLSMLTTKPQSRYILARAIGISERRFRRAVHELRLEGNLIVSDSKTGGYRLGTKEEAKATARELRSRAYDLFKDSQGIRGCRPRPINDRRGDAVMMWCDNCKKAVEPSSHNEYEIPNVNVGGYETIQVLTCPVCGQEVYQEPGECAMCGEYIAPGKALCTLCSDDIESCIDLLAEYRKLDTKAVKDGFAEYLNMEDS